MEYIIEYTIDSCFTIITDKTKRFDYIDNGLYNRLNNKVYNGIYNWEFDIINKTIISLFFLCIWLFYNSCFTTITLRQ